MQANLSDINQLMIDWYSLTLDNPLYAGALVLSVCLITVIFYSIRIYFLKRKRNLTQQANDKLQAQLHDIGQKNKLAEDKMLEVTELMAKEQQIANKLADKLAQRNQKVVESIKQLAEKFNLSEQLVESGNKLSSDFVWQQQDNIQLQLADKLQAKEQEHNTLQTDYAQEKEKFSQQNRLIEKLQVSLDKQVAHTTQLEQKINAFELTRQQQKQEAEEVLVDKVAEMQVQHQLELNALRTELTQDDINSGVPESTESSFDTSEVKFVKVEADEVLVDSVQAEESASAHIDTVSVTQDSNPDTVDHMQQQQEAVQLQSTDSVVNASAAIKDLFSTEKQASETVDTHQPIEDHADVLVAPVSPQPEREETHFEPDYAKSNIDIAGKFKNLFAKDKKTQVKAEPQPEPVSQTEIAAPEVQRSAPEEAFKPDYSESNFDISAKVTGLFGRDKKTKPESVPEAVSQPGNQPEVGISEVRPAEPQEAFVPDYSESSADISGKITGFFAKNKKAKVTSEASKQSKAAVEEVPLPDSVAEVVPSAQDADADDTVFEPDYSQSNLHIPDKFKKLFGKK